MRNIKLSMNWKNLLLALVSLGLFSGCSASFSDSSDDDDVGRRITKVTVSFIAEDGSNIAIENGMPNVPGDKSVNIRMSIQDALSSDVKAVWRHPDDATLKNQVKISKKGLPKDIVLSPSGTATENGIVFTATIGAGELKVAGEYEVHYKVQIEQIKAGKVVLGHQKSGSQVFKANPVTPSGRADAPSPSTANKLLIDHDINSNFHVRVLYDKTPDGIVSSRQISGKIKLTNNTPNKISSIIVSMESQSFNRLNQMNFKTKIDSITLQFDSSSNNAKQLLDIDLAPSASKEISFTMNVEGIVQFNSSEQHDVRIKFERKNNDSYDMEVKNLSVKITFDENPGVQSPQTSEDLKSKLTDLVTRIVELTPASGRKDEAVDYIIDQYKKVNLKPLFEDNSYIKNLNDAIALTSKNTGAMLEGSSKHCVCGGKGVSQTIVIGAHHDSTGKGANDNGTGVATVLALAEIFANKYKLSQPNRTLMFVTYTESELRLGSQNFAQFLKDKWLDDNNKNNVKYCIKAIINLDMLAVKGTGLQSPRQNIHNGISINPQVIPYNGSDTLASKIIRDLQIDNFEFIRDYDYQYIDSKLKSDYISFKDYLVYNLTAGINNNYDDGLSRMDWDFFVKNVQVAQMIIQELIDAQ